MICVAMSGVDEATCREITLRLHGATVSPFDATAVGHAATDACDAVAFVGPRSPDEREVQRIVTSGKHVLFATETVMSMEWIETLIDYSRLAGVEVMVTNPDHFLPSRQLIKQQLFDAFNLGHVGLIRIHRWESSPANRDLDSTRLPAPLVRDMELAMWLMDGFPNLVYAVERTTGEREGNSVGSIQVHLDGCGMVLVDYTDGLPAGDGYQSLTVIGSDGAAYADDHQNQQLVYGGGCARAMPTGEGVLALAALVQDFVDELRSKNELWPGVGEWRVARSMADAVRRSLDLRQAVPVKGFWQ